MKKNHSSRGGITFLFSVIFSILIPSVKAQVITQTYSYTGTIVNFTVPTCVTVLTIQALGAQGGYHPTSTVASGLGASITGVVTVSSGQVLKILVGQQPSSPAGNGGGGGTFVTDMSNNPLVIAGGGGGSSGGTDSSDKNGQSGTTGGTGAAGGGLGGTSGNGGSIGATFASGAGGGLLTNGATGWTANTGGNSYTNGGAATTQAASGGFGGGGSGSLYYVGGGGGGYSGGGSGSNSTGAGVGGGGGSYNAGTNQANLAGVNSGNGLVTISYNFGGSGVIGSMSPTVGICPGGSATLTAGGNVLSYTWSTNSNAQSIVVSPNTTTSYTLSGTNNTGCISNSILNVTVHPLPSISVTTSKNLICVGDTALLTASGADTYTWTNGPSTASMIVTPQSNVNTAYTVIATSTAGCVNSTVATPNVNPLVLTTSANTVICIGKSTLLNASGAVGSYGWTNNTTGNTTPFQSTSVSPTVITVYTASGIDVNNCTLTQTVSVGVNPNPTVTASAVKTVVCRGEPVVLTAGGAGTYSWSNGAITQTASITPPLNIIYVYTVTGTDANGCSAAATISLKVELCTGIGEASESISGMTVFPNPGSGLFQLKTKSMAVKLAIQIYNASGMLIKTMDTITGSVEIDLQKEPNGIYFIHVSKESGAASVTKIIKE